MSDLREHYTVMDESSLAGYAVHRNNELLSELFGVRGLRRALADHPKFALNLYCALCETRWIKIDPLSKNAVETLLSRKQAAELLCELLNLDPEQDYMTFFCNAHEGRVDLDVAELMELLGYKAFTKSNKEILSSKLQPLEGEVWRLDRLIKGIADD